MSSPLISVSPKSANRSLGAILVDSGKLTIEDANRVLRLQKEKSIQFGAAAIELGLLTHADVERALASQFDYPYLHKGESQVSPEVVAAYEPHSDQVEALRMLRSQLMLRWIQAEAKQNLVAIASGSSGEGRSYLASNLAVVFSQLGERTLLIDADMRNPRQHELFGLDNRQGLSSILAERSSLEIIKRIPGLKDLSVIPAGPVPPNPQELLSRETFEKLLQVVGRSHDVVLLDMPAAALSADWQLIAAKARGIAIVARKNHTSMEVLATLKAQIEDASATPVGVVLGEF
jgi:receptor protein-tyrosine kinase